MIIALLAYYVMCYFFFFNSLSHVQRLIWVHVSVQNENRTLWKLGTLPPGLITFYSTTKPLDKSWHVLGLGYNPSINMDEIRNAAVVHFNGNMKPWLDIAMNQFRSIWTKYVDYDNEFIQSCNFGLWMFKTLKSKARGSPNADPTAIIWFLVLIVPLHGYT